MVDIVGNAIWFQFLSDVNVISYCRPRTFELCHIFKQFVSCCYITIMYVILLMTHVHTRMYFRKFCFRTPVVPPLCNLYCNIIKYHVTVGFYKSGGTVIVVFKCFTVVTVADLAQLKLFISCKFLFQIFDLGKCRFISTFKSFNKSM